jgi:hypothetical protein
MSHLALASATPASVPPRRMFHNPTLIATCASSPARSSTFWRNQIHFVSCSHAAEGSQSPNNTATG